MSETTVVALEEVLSELVDPRVVGRVRYSLKEMVVMAVCAVLAGADNWVEIAAWSEQHLGWLQERLGLAVEAAPAHDTFGRLFSLLDSQALQGVLQGWLVGVTEPLAGEVVAIDGKHLRRSHDRWQGWAAVQVVNAWACTQQLALAQVTVAPDSNEVTAVPALLEQLALTGCIVTLDALHTQRALAAQLVAQGADYVLPVKENQPILSEAVQSLFSYADECAFANVAHSYYERVEKGHGRIALRHCWAIDEADFLHYLATPTPWPRRASIVRLHTERRQGDRVTQHERFFISSLPADATLLAQVIRTHWHIENQLHWVLDVVFREDDSRIRVGYAAQNFALLRRFALSLLEQDTSTKGGIQLKRKQAAWNPDYLASLLPF